MIILVQCDNCGALYEHDEEVMGDIVCCLACGEEEGLEVIDSWED